MKKILLIAAVVLTAVAALVAFLVTGSSGGSPSPFAGRPEYLQSGNYYIQHALRASDRPVPAVLAEEEYYRNWLQYPNCPTFGRLEDGSC